MFDPLSLGVEPEQLQPPVLSNPLIVAHMHASCMHVRACGRHASADACARECRHFGEWSTVSCLAYIAMAYTVMAYTVMAYIVMA